MNHLKREVRSERNSGRFLRDPVFWLSAAVLGTSFTFGGATRQGLVSEAIPELLSLPLIALALPRATPFLKRFPSASALLVGLIILPCLQLVPLPPALWSVLPGRSLITEILTTAQVPMSWRPISLIPVETWRALLSLLPALAIFLATLSLERGGETTFAPSFGSDRRRQRACWLCFRCSAAVRAGSTSTLSPTSARASASSPTQTISAASNMPCCLWALRRWPRRRASVAGFSRS